MKVAARLCDLHSGAVFAGNIGLHAEAAACRQAAGIVGVVVLVAVEARHERGVTGPLSWLAPPASLETKRLSREPRCRRD